MRHIIRRPLIVLSALAILGSFTPTADAQYFGRNKVQ